MLLFLLILFILAGGVIAALAYENIATLSVDVHLVFFRWHFPALPLGVFLLMSFVLGALLLYVVTLVSALRERRELRRLRKRVTEFEAMQAGRPAQVTTPLVTDPRVTLPMPGVPSPSPSYQLQYLFPPPAPKRDQNQGW